MKNKNNTMKIQQDLSQIYTRQQIPESQKLHYLICIPCVNRLERNAIQIIHKTFENFEENHIFEQNESTNYQLDILLFESGSKDLSYLAFLKPFLEKYKDRIKILFSKKQLNGPENIIRVFQFANEIEIQQKYHFVIWMDDDIVVCKNFMFHCDKWIRKYMNYTLFGSLYSPYQSYPIEPTPQQNCEKSNVRSYHGSCCTIFKPILAKYITPLWFQTDKLRNVTEPDLRFRESILKFFPQITTFLVSKPSLVQHLNIGSAIYQHKQIKKGHHAREFIGMDKEPQWMDSLSLSSPRNVKMEIHIPMVRKEENEKEKMMGITSDK